MAIGCVDPETLPDDSINRAPVQVELSNVRGPVSVGDIPVIVTRCNTLLCTPKPRLLLSRTQQEQVNNIVQCNIYRNVGMGPSF